ncbi:protein-tyrosine phosphatase-like protein [Dipodascopsis uninucleata]
MISQVSDVEMVRRGSNSRGTLFLTTHHLIFRENEPSKREVWICYPILALVERRPFSSFTGFSALRLRCRDFAFIALHFKTDNDCKEVYDTLMTFTCIRSVEKLYAFYYRPGSLERAVNTWNFYDPIKEFERMGVGKWVSTWRFTSINEGYQYCPTYPAVLVVPTSITDTVLNYAGKYRSKSRIPSLSYIHKLNNCTITRCSQPLVGLKQNRSPQDERFIHAIFSTTVIPNTYGASQENLIADARPTTNALAQTALGAGTENMENYKFARKVYLGIDNIHVMRDSLNKVYEALKDSDITPLPPNRELLYKSNWLKHISTIMEGAVLMAQRLHYFHSHVLVHCSDGWDRTAQLSSLAQIFLDPYFRTIDGFIILVEKEWLAFGHRFAERCGHLASEKTFVQASDRSSSQSNSQQNFFNNDPGVKYTAPVFHQFLDCVYQILRQFPERFEFQERFLRRMLYHLYSCQYGTFLYNCERERREANVDTRTQSVWNYFVVRRKEFLNSRYKPELDQGDRGNDAVLFPNPKDIKWWHEIYGRTEEEMSVATLNGIGSTATASAEVRNRHNSPNHPQRHHQHQQQHSVEERSYHRQNPTPKGRPLSQISTPPPNNSDRHNQSGTSVQSTSEYDYEGTLSSFKEVANSTISSWTTSIAETSKEWANAASPYLQTTTSYLPTSSYVTDIDSVDKVSNFEDGKIRAEMDLASTMYHDQITSFAGDKTPATTC